MQLNLKTLLLFWLRLSLLFACNQRKSAVHTGERRLRWRQQEETMAGLVEWTRVPPLPADEGAACNCYRVRLLSKINPAVKDPGIMQYINFDIRNSFWCIQGTDSIACSICERVPDIAEGAFVYMVCFNKTASVPAARIKRQLCIADTVMGFTVSVFDTAAE